MCVCVCVFMRACVLACVTTRCLKILAMFLNLTSSRVFVTLTLLETARSSCFTIRGSAGVF